MWKTQVLIENKAGASGTIAADYVANQPGDGSILLMAHINSHALAPACKSWATRRERLPAHQHGGRHAQPADLQPGQPAKTVKDLVACARPTPARSALARPAMARPSTWRWRCSSCRPRSLRSTCPTRARGPLLTDLIGGQVSTAFETMTARPRRTSRAARWLPWRRRGQARQGPPQCADDGRTGFPGFEATTWYGWSAPARCRSPWPSA
jgi:tripartite-type tricarboxylate transporter receptor subunit TctC